MSLKRGVLTVAMITMNEEAAVSKVIQDIQRVVPDAEVLIVDSSKDRTPEIAESLGARVIRQFPPRGYSVAMDTALRAATGEVVVTLDCDDTYPVEQIPILAEMVLKDGYDIVDGRRVGYTHKPDAMPWLNYAANIGFAGLASVLFAYPIRDLHSGMRAYRKALINDLRYDPTGPALPVELLLLPLKMKKRFKSVPIDYHERIGTSTMSPLRGAWWTLRRIIRARLA